MTKYVLSHIEHIAERGGHFAILKSIKPGLRDRILRVQDLRDGLPLWLDSIPPRDAFTLGRLFQLELAGEKVDSLAAITGVRIP